MYYLTVRMYAPTNWRVNEYENIPNVNAEVSAQAPYGSKEGENISIYTQVGMGNMNSRTEYVYRWNAKGKAPAGNGKGSPLIWIFPGGILIGGAIYIINKGKKKVSKKPDNRIYSPAEKLL